MIDVGIYYCRYGVWYRRHEFRDGVVWWVRQWRMRDIVEHCHGAAARRKQKVNS